MRLTHRDVKPANILIDDRNEPRLVDLGLAAMAGEDSGAVGTPSYAAPEQLEGATADPTADQFGLGATLNAALTKRGVAAPRFVEAAIERAMSAEPSARYPDIAAFARALRGGRRRRIAIAAAASIAVRSFDLRSRPRGRVRTR